MEEEGKKYLSPAPGDRQVPVKVEYGDDISPKVENPSMNYSPQGTGAQEWGLSQYVSPDPKVQGDLSQMVAPSGFNSCDMDVIQSKNAPQEAIKSLFFNTYSALIRILRTCYSFIQTVALDAARQQQVDATEEEVKQVHDLRALFECLEVDKKWNDVHLLNVAIMSLPPEEVKRETARLVLDQYKSYLKGYIKATSIKEGKSLFARLHRKRGREGRLVVTEVTFDKEIEDCTCKDCLDLWKWFLIGALEIPEDCIEFCDAKRSNSTTLIFKLSQAFAEEIEGKLSKPDVVWIIKQLSILRVRVVGMFNKDLRQVLPVVPTVSIREGLESGVDFMSLTKSWSSLMYSLVDQVPTKQAQLDNVRSVSVGLARPSISGPVTEIHSEHESSHVESRDDLNDDSQQNTPVVGPGHNVVPSQGMEDTGNSTPLQDLFNAVEDGQWKDVQSLLDGGRCKVDDEDEDGFTAILLAAVNGHLMVLETLVKQYSGNVLHRNKRGCNAFHFCAMFGNVATAQFLAPMMEGHLFDVDGVGYTALHWAAREGQFSMVEYLVKSCGLDVTAKDKWGKTQLMSAVLRGHADVARFLLESGSDVLEQDNQGLNALHICAMEDHVAIAQFLAPLMEGHLFDGDGDGYTALHWAAQEGRLSMVEYLVKSCGFDVTAKDKRGKTPLLRAVLKGRADVVRFLLESGSDVHEQDNQGRNALHICAMHGNVAIAQFLAPVMEGHQFDVDVYGYTALHWAVQGGQLSMVEYLIKSCGLDVTAKDKQGSNSFHICAMHGNVAIAQFLAPMMEGHLFDVTDGGYTALHWAAQRGQLSMAEYLVKSCGLDVTVEDKWGRTALLRAVLEGHADVIHFLLESGSDLHEQDNRGCNAFHLCAKGGHVAIAQFLAPMMEGHLFDITDDGYTALHWATQEGELSMVEYLVKSCGLDVTAKDKWGTTPLLIAVLEGHADVARFLLESGSDVREQDNQGANGFHMCAVGGNVAIALFLAPMMEGHLFDVTDSGYTALHCAAQEGQLSMAEHLVKFCGLDVTAKDKWGKTPLLIAVLKGHANVARFLLENGSDVHEQDNQGANSFHWSAVGGNVAIAQFLTPIMEGHLFDVDVHGYTALHWAAQEGRLSMAEHLVKSCGFNLTAKDKWGKTPLLRAVLKGHADVARFLLESGSDVHEQDNQGSNSFHLCAAGGNVAIAQFLAPIMEGHLFDVTDGGYTALHWAAQEGRLSMVEYLVKSCGFDVTAKDKWGFAPLLKSVLEGHADVVRFLMESGSDVHERDKIKGRNAFHWSAVCGHLDVAQYLAPKMEGQMFDLTNDKDTALHLATEHGHLSMVEFLVKTCQFNVKDKNKHGQTPFLMAASNDHVKIAHFLLEHGGSTIERTDLKETALHLAAKGGRLNMVKFLLPLFGERVHETNSIQETCWDLAEAAGHRHVLEHLDSNVPTLRKYGCVLQ